MTNLLVPNYLLLHSQVMCFLLLCVNPPIFSPEKIYITLNLFYIEALS